MCPGLVQCGLKLCRCVDRGEVDVGHERVGSDEADVPIPVGTEGVLLDDDLTSAAERGYDGQVGSCWGGEHGGAVLGREGEGKREDLLEVHHRFFYWRLSSSRTQIRGSSSSSNAAMRMPDSRTRWRGARKARRLSTR